MVGKPRQRDRAGDRRGGEPDGDGREQPRDVEVARGKRGRLDRNVQGADDTPAGGAAARNVLKYPIAGAKNAPGRRLVSPLTCRGGAGGGAREPAASPSRQPQLPARATRGLRRSAPPPP